MNRARPTLTLKRHPIQVASRRSGLSPDVLRAWERRYQLVQPGRSDTGRRLYSDEDIERLRLLQRATSAGRQISRVAGLSTAALHALVAEDERQAAEVRSRRADVSEDAAAHLQACWRAVDRFDSQALESALMRAALALSATVLLDEVAAPLMAGIGERWAAGHLDPAYEHLTTAVVRHVLDTLAGGCAHNTPGPSVVVATPAGQRHELGALFVSAVAASEGWRVTYLGSDLPAEQIGRAARAANADAIALSLVYPEGDPAVEEELRGVRAACGQEMAIVAGGRAAATYAPVLAAEGIDVAPDVAGFRDWLRSGRAAASGD